MLSSRSRVSLRCLRKQECCEADEMVGMEAAHRPACAPHPCLTSHAVSLSVSLLLSPHLPHPPLLTSWLPPLCFCPLTVCTGCQGCSQLCLLILTACSSEEDARGSSFFWTVYGLAFLSSCPSLLQSGSGLEGTGVKHSCPQWQQEWAGMGSFP